MCLDICHNKEELEPKVLEDGLDEGELNAEEELLESVDLAGSFLEILHLETKDILLLYE